jgi:hypothetical protein
MNLSPDQIRAIVKVMIWLQIWRFTIVLRNPVIVPKRGTKWLLAYLIRCQNLDESKHAPCCPANHFHHTRLIFHSCTCAITRAAILAKMGAR